MATNYIQTTLFMLNRPEPIRQASILMVLASGVGSGASLLDGLKAHADESRSPWADQVHSLRALLEQGLPLSAALAGTQGLLPETTRTSIRIGEETGTLREVLLDESARLAGITQPSQTVGFDPANTMLWLVILGNVMISLVSFIMIFIIPKFKKIFEDFDVELPPLTQSLIGGSDFLIGYWYLFMLPAMSTIFGGAAFVIWALIKKTRYGHIVYSEHWPRFWVPDLLRYLSIASAASRPFSVVVETMVKEMRPGRAAQTLRSLLHRVTAGTDILSGMHADGLISVREHSFLEASARSGHLDWGLQYLGRTLDRDRFRWLRRLANCFQPVVILGTGLVVMFVVVALFMPLIGLTEELAVW